MAKVVKLSKQRRLESELGILFGRDVVAMAKQTEVIDLNLDSSLLDNLHESANDLERLKHDLARQRELIKSMGNELALALCMYLVDSEMGIKILRVKLSA